MKAYKLISPGLLVALAGILAGRENPGQGRATSRHMISTPALADASASAAKGGEPLQSQATFPAQFQATIYEVEALAGHADGINAKALETD